MTRNFVCKPLRERDKSNKLLSAGMHWSEEASWRSGSNQPAMILALVGLGCWVVVFALVAANGAPVPGLIGLVSFGGLGLYAWRKTLGDLPTRSVVFRRDGTIEAPEGLPRSASARSIRLHIDQIGSIEVGPNLSGMPQDWTKSVQIIDKEGQTTAVGQRFHEEEAREVAVGLSLALKELRDEINESARNATPLL